MEAKVKSNPIMNFIRKILDKLSNSALFSVLSTDSSSTMGDEYLEDDDVLEVEEKLMKFFPKKNWSRLHHQLVLFGRYFCKSQKPLCENCPFNKECKYRKL